MSLTEARERLLHVRAAYSIAAGLILFVVVPLFQGLVLVPRGYAAAVAPAVAQRDFSALLVWVPQQLVAYRLFHLLQLIPFLLAITLPLALRDALWPGDARTSRAARTALWAGRLGFALFALVIVAGLFTDSASAGEYSAATSAAGRAAALNRFLAGYALQKELSQVLGGLLLAVFLLLVSRRMGQIAGAPPLFRFFGYLLGGIEALNALLFAFDPTQVETPFSTIAFFGLALWLIGLGLVLPRLRPLPAEQSAPPAPPTRERKPRA